MRTKSKQLKLGDMVVLRQLPQGLVDGLPLADKTAISDIVGRPVKFLGFRSKRRAELEFTDKGGTNHSIFVRRGLLGKLKKTSLAGKGPHRVARQIRQMLKQGGSPEHAAGVQWFFKEEIKSHGWYTAPLRRAARAERKRIVQEYGQDFLVQVADQLFSGAFLEEKIFAVLLLEKLTDDFGDREFKLFESWLTRISSWADHDGLVHCLIAPMVVAKPARLKSVFRWAKSKDRWHRRAACVALIQGTRQKLFFPEIVQLSNLLMNDQDGMVQKGLGWLLRETTKADSRRTVPYLMKIRSKTSRLVLRTACETLSPAARRRILS